MRPELKYGLLAGAGLCVWMAGEYLLGLHTTRVALGEYSGYFSVMIPLGLLYLLLQRTQAANPAEPLGLGRGLATGLYASFIAAVIVYVFLVAYSRFFNPGWLDYTLDWKVAQWRARNISEIEIRQNITFYRQTHSPAGLIGTIVVGLTLMGGLCSLGLTFVVQRLFRVKQA